MKPMNDKQEAAFAYLVLQFSFVRPIELVLRNLNEGIYEYGNQQDMNFLNETLQDCLMPYLIPPIFTLNAPPLRVPSQKKTNKNSSSILPC